MIKLERTSVMNFENAMRGARNPLNSWARSDSMTDEKGVFHFGLVLSRIQTILDWFLTGFRRIRADSGSFTGIKRYKNRK
mgnify:CR=1 FL=1